ncbi:hypothetical protein RJT17_37195 [Streptomyces sp. P5-A9]|uniref:hypothetical protein n=1 Tax=Streptomyces sp. P5-A9 TaxID=3071730 RepID=UPI002FCCAEE8
MSNHPPVAPVWIRGITIRQPWTTCILTGERTIKNRPRHWSWRGWLLLHSGQSVDTPAFRNPLVARTIRGRHLHTGAILGVARLTACHQDPDKAAPCDPWAHPGSHHLALADIHELALQLRCPALAGRVASGDDREQAGSALNLAGAILAGSNQPHGAGDVRAQHVAEVEILLVVVNEYLRTASDRSEYAYLLESMLSFEGVVSWREDLAWGLVNEEYEVSCPSCQANLFIVIGERGFFSTSGDYALSEDDVETTPLRPANPADMDGIGRRLHDIVLTDGHQDVANAMTYVFGDATCPDCETGFSVADQVSSDWSATH